MNERIKELWEEATVSTWPRPGKFTAGEYDYHLKKFAELIVLEMCNVLDKAQWDKGEDWVCADGTRIIPQVKEHFGVEE